MDEIQKILIKARRKDLAQKYYEKISAKGYVKSEFKTDINETLKSIITPVDVTSKEYWKNSGDTIVAIIDTGKISNRHLAALMKLNPDELHTVYIDGKLIWRLWWD